MKKFILRMGVCMLLILGASGCATLTDSANRPADVDVSPHDMQLRLDVLNRLQQDGLTGRHMFGVTSQDGVITLYGSIGEDAIRLRAVAIARHTPGVVGVNDRIMR